MSSFKRLASALLALCLLFSLTLEASALSVRIRSVRETDAGSYAVEGRLEDSGASNLYTATYDQTGKMTGIGSVSPGADGSWSYTGGRSSADGPDVVKAFAIDGASRAPLGENGYALAVTTTAELAAALTNGDCDNIFIARSMELSAIADAEKIVRVDKTVTVSDGVTLTVPKDYALHLNSGARLNVAGILDIQTGAQVGVSGSNTFLSGENTERIGEAQLVLDGGTVNNAGVLILWAASSDQSEDYDGGTGGVVTGVGSGGRIDIAAGGKLDVAGRTQIETTGVYNNGGNLLVTGFTVTAAAGGILDNHCSLTVYGDGAISGAGTIENSSRLRLEGGDLSGMLALNNHQEIQAIDTYLDDGSGKITFDPATIGDGVTVDDDNGNGWIYAAAQLMSEAALRYALDADKGYGGAHLEFVGGSSLALDSFTLPAGKTLLTYVPLALKAGGTADIFGTLELYRSFTIPADGALHVEKRGTVYAEGGSDQALTNAGALTVNGVLEVGNQDYNQGVLVNTGALTVNGGLNILPGAWLQNDGTVTGSVTLVTDRDKTVTGAVAGANAAATTIRTALEAATSGELEAGLSGSYGALYLTDGIELDASAATAKDIIIPQNSWLRISGGVTLTLSGQLVLDGWMENRGTLTLESTGTLNLRGSLYNSDGDSSGVMIVGGKMDLYPGAMFKNHNNITVTDGGAVLVGGILAWGSGQAIPAAGTGGYSVYADGAIRSTTQTADNLAQYGALMDDSSCDCIVLGFTMDIVTDTTFSKSVSVPAGRGLTVASGVTLTVTDGAWLSLDGGTLVNNGTIVVANENGNQGHLTVNSNSVLNLTSGVILVYGQLQFNDRYTTTVIGEEHIAYQYYANLFDLARVLYEQLSERSAYTQPDAADLAACALRYADWNELEEDGRVPVSFMLKNMSDTALLESTRSSEADIYLEPYSWRTYGTVRAVLDQLWKTGKGAASCLPDSVALVEMADGSYIQTYNYGSGSQLEQLFGTFMAAFGNVTVSDPATYTVNGGSVEQSISYRTFSEAVTVAWNGESGFETSNINFTGCRFEKGILLVNSGSQFRVWLNDCTLCAVDGKDCQIFVQAGTGLNRTDNSQEVYAKLSGTTKALLGTAETVLSVGAACTARVESYIPGGSFLLNGVTYIGAETLDADDCFTGKYQIDENGADETESFHAGNQTVRVIVPGDAAFREFHIWSNIRNDVTVQLDGAFASGGSLSLCDDDSTDSYSICAAGSVGAATGDTLGLNLHGSVDLSGLMAVNTDFMAESESAVRLVSGGAWLTPAIVGNYNTAAVEVGSGNLTDAYTIVLYQRTWDEEADEHRNQVGTVTYEPGSDRTYVYSLGTPDELELEVTCKTSGATVRWENLQRKIDSATQSDLAAALYQAYGTNAAFAGAENAADFATGNGLMTQVTDSPVTLHEIVSALLAVKEKLGVTLRTYYGESDIQQISYDSEETYDSAFKEGLLELVRALALGSSVLPHDNAWGTGSPELAVYFDGGSTVGGTIYDSRGNSALLSLLAAFQAACSGEVYLGDNPNIVGAAFAGSTTFTMGSSSWSGVNLIDCSFSDGTGSQALVIKTDCGGYLNFEACDFDGATGGFTVSLAPLTQGTYMEDILTLQHVPDGSIVHTSLVRMNAVCAESEGAVTVNGVKVTGRDATEADFMAGMWWDRYDNGDLAACLGVSGAAASIEVSAGAEAFGGLSLDDCDADLALSINSDWTPDYEHGLSLRNWSGKKLSVTGTIAGGSGENNRLGLELIGKIDVSDAVFTGQYYLFTGKWNDVETGQSFALGEQNLNIFYDGYDAGTSTEISLGNADAGTDSAVVGYYHAGAESNVGINGLSGIRLRENGTINLGYLKNAYTGGTDFGVYTLQLYTLSGEVWTPTGYTVELGADSCLLIPATALTLPYTALLSLTHSDGGISTTFNIMWRFSEEESGDGECDAATEAELLAALADAEIYKVNLTEDITLSADRTFSKEVVIGEGVTLTVPAGIELILEDGLTVSGMLSVAGNVHVYGWIDGGDDWENISTTDGGQVYTYTDFNSLAIDLYNTFRADYGLTDSAVRGAYEDCYAADYFTYADDDSLHAINFLIENGVIPDTATDLNGWVKITYAGAMELLDGLADVLETKLERGTITGYGLTEFESEDFLCNSDDGSDWGALLDSFIQAVGAVGVTDAAVYTPGLYNNQFHYLKTYAADVTVRCGQDEYSFCLFADCTFNGDLIVYGGDGAQTDNILLAGCTVNGTITVYDDDGNTELQFEGVTTVPDITTVTVTEKTIGSAEDSARLGAECDSVILHDLPSGVPVFSDCVSAAVINSDTATIIKINGVVITGSGAGTGYVAASTWWEQITGESGTLYLPVLVVSGSTARVDARSDTTGGGDGFAKFWLYADADAYAVDTLLLPKAGSGVNVNLADGARFQVSFDGGETVIDPVIGGDAVSGYYLTVPTDAAYTYEIGEGENAPSPVTPVAGKITLTTNTRVAMQITYSDGTTSTTVGFDELAAQE